MKKLLVCIMLLSSGISFANSNDKIESIRNVIDSVAVPVDSYHCSRLKGYLEGLRLEKGYSLKISSEGDCRMNLVVLKKMLDTVTQRYPEVGVKSIFKKLNIVGTGNSFGKCEIWGGEETLIDRYKYLADSFTFGIRDYNDEKFTSYTLPVVRRCIKNVTEFIEKNQADIVID